MTIRLFVLFSLMAGYISHAQQEPVFSLNETNQSFYNPSATAVNDLYLVNTQYRNQWIGFNGAPVTYLVNFEMDINKINSGVGLVAMRDEIGLNSNHSIGLNYRYTFNMGEFSRLSAGIGVNWIHQYYTNGWITPNNSPDPFLPLPNNSTNSTWNLNSGLHFERKNLTVGLGAMNVISAFRNNSPIFHYQKQLHTNLYSNYTFELSDKFSLSPSVFILTDWAKLSSLIALKGTHYNRFWWLAGYRVSGQAVNAGAGIQFWNRLHIGLAYEYFFGKQYIGFNHTVECNVVFRIKK